MRPLTIGSLFSGIGGLELGLERGLAAAGVPARTLWQVEQNDHARAVLARHWPNAERYTDVRDIAAATVAPVDLLCGGFPCQDISTAGKGAGLAGERSGLFFEMARIIRELRPRIVVMENVPAITTRGLDTVLGTLAALGYAARWGGLRASEVGAPHRRERWFCVAWLADSNSYRHKAADKQPESTGDDGSAAMQGRQAPLWQRCDCCENYWCNRHQQHAHDCPCPSIEYLDIDPYASGGLADSDDLHAFSSKPSAIHSGVGLRIRCDEKGRRARQTKPGMGRDADGLPCRLDAHRWPAPPGPQHPWEPPRTRPQQPHDRDRLKGLGNAVVPLCAALIGAWIGSELVGHP